MISAFKSKLKSVMKKGIVTLYKIMCKVLPVRKNIVLFMSNMGKNYSGNPKAIFEALKKSDVKKSCICVWAFTKLCLNEIKAEDLPEDCRIVQYGGFKYYYYLAVAGKWVFDTRQEPYLVKRKKCIYIQTWHGTPLKKLGLDITEMNMSGEFSTASQTKKSQANKQAAESQKNDSIKKAKLQEYYDAFKKESAKWDYLVAQNKFSSHTFRRCFDYQGKMLMTGYPRNDMLIGCNKAETISAIKEELNIAADKKLLLYAPTWRDDQYLEGGWYKYDSPLDFKMLEKSLGDKCRIIVKLHYLVHLKKGDIPEECIKSGFVIVCGNDVDIAKLYLISDGLITDYSSVMFDYALTKRPMFFFAYDLKQYRDKLRGFYFDFCKEAPGPISQDTKQLIKDINASGILAEKANDLALSNEYQAFIEKYNGYDDGHASERIAQILLK